MMMTAEQKAKQREYQRAWRARNPDKLRAKAKARYAADPERLRQATREWVARNPEAAKQAAKKYRETHPENRRAANVRGKLRRYGLRVEDYSRMLLSQQGRCAICGQTDKLALSVDHDHDTGKVRGLLCRACNKGIGIFRDSQLLLESAQAYLRRSDS